MSNRLYVDSCIPMYLTGAEHPHKRRVMQLVPSLFSAREVLITSAETFQEIIHRYRAIHDPQHLQIAYDALETMVSLVEDVRKIDTDLARDYAARYPGLSSRDCLHAAVMRRIGCERIWSFDRGFDELPFIVRVE